MVALLPMRSALSSSSRKGSAAKSLAFTSRFSPFSVSVTTMTGRRAARSALSSFRVSSFTDHPTFSTKTRIVPPQESPTFHAVSSATPNSSILGWPEAITSSASVTTAPSTQPPETEPRNVPSSLITRLEPAGRGAEPQVSTTVASATPWPAFCQSSAALRISSSRLSILSLPSGCGADQAAVVRRDRGRQGFDQRLHRTQIMHGPEFVNVRQHHFDPLRLGLEAAEAKQRVQPDQPAAGAVQPVHLEGELVVGLALQPVG